MKTSEETVTLSNLAGGAATEKFQHELEKMLTNILDPNAKDGKREITLKVTLLPDERREFIRFDIDCTSKGQPPTSFSANAAIGLGTTGRPEARELVTFGQRELPMDNVTSIQERKNQS